MFGYIFSFEVRRAFRSISTYVYFLILFSVTFLLALLAGGAFQETNFMFAGEKVYANAPLVIDAFFSVINNYIGIIIIVAVIGNAVLKDFSNNTYTMIFTTPVSKFDYLFGRFAAAVFICLLILSGPAFGLMAGYAMPSINPSKVEAFMLSPYVYTYLQTTIPNTIIYGSIFFAVSLMARDIFVIWMSLIIFYVATFASNSLFGSLDNQTIAAFTDPMGSLAKRTISKYWSTWDKNHLHYSLRGLFLANRLVWMGISGAVWFVGYRIFTFSSSPKTITFRKPKLADSSKITFVPSFVRRGELPKVTLSFTSASNLRNLWGLSIKECITIWRNTYFRIILLFGMLLLLLTSTQLGKLFDTTVLPVTYIVVENFGGIFQLFIIILTIMFGGELVWRERDYKMSNIIDSLPVPNWVFYCSKLAGLLFIQIILLGIIFVSGVIVQLCKGYTHLEILLYFKYLYGFRFVSLAMLAVLSIFVQAIVKNKYLGYFIVGLFYFWNISFAELVLKRNLLVFDSDPGLMYSDMNHFSKFVLPFFIYKVYWGAFCVILAVLSSLLWARGTEKGVLLRLNDAKSRENLPSWMVLAAGLIVFIGCGSFIYYNTEVVNKFETEFKTEERQAAYERTYKKFEFAPQPKITDVKLNLDIFPYDRSMHSEGTFVLKNKSNAVIDSVHILLPESLKVNSLSFSRPSRLLVNDSQYAYRIYQLSQPMQPGDTITLNFNVDLVSKGFKEGFDGLGAPLDNGTFVNNLSFLPNIGYDNRGEIANNAHRKKHGLGYRQTANAINDTAAWMRNAFVHDADFITFDATVSTVPDQIAVAPGYLQKDWVENGRRYFHYKMDSKILNFYSFLSARYTVKKEKWHDVSIEIFYQKGHEYNLDRMFRSAGKSLDYYTSQFSPYQYRQLRILEFPRYATFAQSFPNTIPFSEGIGFIANVDDSDKDQIDYPFYVTAHEIGHQWFAHQVIGADVEGSNLLSESLAQYGAIMVMEKEFGEDRLRKFLHIEMDRYLMFRSNESEKEKPWAYVDLGQAYILYEKGGINMHALNKYLGEDSLNHAIQRFIQKYAFQGPPYPTSLDFIAEIRKSTPDSLQYFVTDAFMNITIYDNKITEAKARKEGDQYLVDVTVESNKMYADSTGKESPAPSDNYVEIGIYKNRSTLTQYAMYKLATGVNHVSITTKDKPYKVVVDPRLLLIDRKLDDNEMRIDDPGKQKDSVSAKVRG